jgi:chromosome segregation ATPase
MKIRYSIVLLTGLALFFTSCVSKKKFTEMQNGRLHAEEQVRQLTTENNARAARIQAMIADFESMKNELMESNAGKDQYIDNLNKEMAGLNEQLSEQQQSLQERNFTFGFERERLSETLAEREKTVRALERQISEMERETQQQSSTLSDRNVRISVLNDQISMLEAEKERGERQRSELEQQLAKMREEANALKAQMEEKDQTITRLQNNVNLLKRELGGGEN